MNNRALNVINNNKPFTYFHTRVLDRNTLDLAVATRKSIEIDLSITDDGKVYIGHPLSFYEYFKIPKPNNLLLPAVIEEIKKAGLFLVLDIKNKNLANQAVEIIKYIGVENCLLHSYVNELVFDELLDEKETEAHWPDEHIPLNAVLAISNATDVPLILSPRGNFTSQLTNTEQDKIVEKIINVAKNNAIAVSMNLHSGECPPIYMMEELLSHDILTLLNIDLISIENRPSRYIGLTDNIKNASNI